jgi:hypothetical protein
VEPAPEIVPEPLGGVVAVFAGALELVLALVLGVLDELLEELLELPHAARPNASTTQPASAPNLFLITTSPLAGLSDDVRARASTWSRVPGTVSSAAGALHVNIS